MKILLVQIAECSVNFYSARSPSFAEYRKYF